ncbi:MAG: signal recognition particle-docking protein FtsY [Lachnospiraceae bacterium]|nr:signal recognition particle-docking protein FtsY [Lachnospiraceae bacterium]MBR1875708.1 signal recognition particle-docking protein FtsY [Lachnospiraceae bacterium]
MASIFTRLSGFFSGYEELTDEFYEDLEETLVMGDVGFEATEEIIEELKKRVAKENIKVPDECRRLLSQIVEDRLKEKLSKDDYDFEQGKAVVLLVGVNGVGKTTTAGKLAARYKRLGKKVILAAADTFRAAATEQLNEWAVRAGVDIIRGTEGGDPGAVVYDAIHAAKARNADILICDTAGRLHNKKNLMNELKKINNIITSEYPEAVKETLVVVDAGTGQNAKEQAKEFKEVTDVNGVVLTKLDGSAKGGIVIAIESELMIPVKFVGVGEKITDLKKFDVTGYAAALTGSEELLKKEEEEKKEIASRTTTYETIDGLKEVVIGATEQEKEDAFAFFRSLRKD